MISKVQTSSYEPLPGSEQITDPAKITRMLERFTRRYTPLTVQVPGHKEHYSSCIVKVDEKHVLLDELMPSTGHQLLVTEGVLQVMGSLEGVVIQLFTTLERVDEKGNVLTYYMKKPKLLEYQQRRQDFRVRIPMIRKLPVIIENRSGKMLKGELHDLSHGGAGMIFLADKTFIEAGKLHECAIELPDGNLIYCTVEFRYSKGMASRSQDRQFIGVQFVGLLPVQSRLIGRCIIELERDFIRKRSAY